MTEPTILMPNRINVTISEANAALSLQHLQDSRDLLPATPAMSDDDYNVMEKMGAERRKEFDLKIAILEKYGAAYLSPKLSVTNAKTDVSVMDSALANSTKAAAIANDFLRLATMAGAEGYNMMKCQEEQTAISAAQGDEDAIKALNELNAIDKQRRQQLAAEKAKVEKVATKKAKEKILTAQAAKENKEVLTALTA